MIPLLLLPLAFGPPPTQRWAVELELEAIGGDIDVMHVDSEGTAWLAVSGETNREGRARLYQRRDDGTWIPRWEGPTATDLDITSPRPGEVYLGFNRPLAGYMPTLLRVGEDGIESIEVPRQRLDAFEYRQLGAYYLWSEEDGWAAGQNGALWRLTSDGWTALPEIFEPSRPNAQRYGYKLFFEGRDFGLQMTLGGWAGFWDGSQWHSVPVPAGRDPHFLYMTKGLALDAQGWLRYGRSGWVELADACDDVDAADVLGRRIVADESGRVALYGDYLLDLGDTAWSCRHVGVPFAPRAVATHEGHVWVLSDDAVRRLVTTDAPTFVPAPADALPPGLWFPTVVDIDDDGDDDVLVAAGAESNRMPSSATDGELTLWRAVGGGAFAREPAGPGLRARVMPQQVVAVDIDGDDDLDLGVLRVGEGLHLLRNVGGEWRDPEWVGDGMHRLYAFDLEGDGDVDLAADGLIFVNDGVGQFETIEHPSRSPEPSARLGYWFDYDLDGDADFAASMWRVPSHWLRNDGAAGFVAIELGAAVEAATIADGNGDGRPDLLAQRLHYHHLGMPLRRCGLVEAPPCVQTEESSIPGGIVADLDRDGRDDRIVGSLRVYETPPNAGAVYLATDDGWRETTAISGRFVHAHLLDADGDGDLDIYTRDGGLSLNTTDPDTVVRIRLSTARSDRRAEGAWVVLRDSDGAPVASGPVRSGAARLGVPDRDATYTAEVTFPTGTVREALDVRPGIPVTLTELEPMEHRIASFGRWCTSAWLLARPGRDGSSIVASLILLVLLLPRLGLGAQRRLAVAAGAGLSLIAAPFAIPRGGLWPWIVPPLAVATAVALAWLRRRYQQRLAQRTAGPYTLLERLGEGTAAEVWSARREGEEVALKLFAAEPMQHPESRERFFREARIGAELRHPNLVRIRGSGQLPDGRCYLAMERVEGTPLDRKLEASGALPAEAVRRIVADIARALEALHEAGVVHRDVKPGNVVLRPDGSAVLMDLGLARSALFKTVTRHDLAVGTLAYMSPEQSLGRPLDGRTDLWSLGVMAYELLTARRPFDGMHELELLYAIHNLDAPPVTDLRPDAPEDLAELIARCLHRDLDQRVASARAISSARSGPGESRC